MSTAPQKPLAIRERLSEVRYEIRGELARRARELEAQGRKLIKLNIGNPGAFGFRAPEHLQRAIADDMGRTDPYTHQQGLPEAREAVAKAYARRQHPDAHPDRIFIGNGVSELIDLSLRALLNPGDEVLVPSPDYPLWSAATILNDGRPVYYRCAPENGFQPDPVEIETLVSSRTRAIVLINPNNPSGASYSRELLERIVAIAVKHNLLLMVDEIYDQVLYDGAAFVPVAPLAGEHPCITFSGLSKVHRACGWRVGWALLSGEQSRINDLRNAMDLLGALRLCANVPGQYAIDAAVNGPDTISALCAPGGRLYETRRAVIEACAASSHLSLVAPAGALYAFPAVVGPAARNFDDHTFALDLMNDEGVLVVPGSSFNVPYRHHFRVTLMPEAAVMRDVFARIDRALTRRAEAVNKVVPLKSRSADVMAAVGLPRRYLALGDSYTIGEGVAAEQRWPEQLTEGLRAYGWPVAAPQLIATTGWTTDELQAGIDAAAPQGPFDLVSLAIGVNNQYRERTLDAYRTEFDDLLLRAIGFADAWPERVVVLSIPDWGLTPFARAQGRDAALIAAQIDAFNTVAAERCAARAVRFVDITATSRDGGDAPDMLVDDGLHPSGAMYARWTALALPAARDALS